MLPELPDARIDTRKPIADSPELQRSNFQNDGRAPSSRQPKSAEKKQRTAAWFTPAAYDF
jgi:hypothetical protein